MKKLLVALSALALITGFSTTVFGAEEENQVQTVAQKNIEILPTMNTKSSNPNRVWVGTFQIVWNEFSENLVRKPIKFVDYKSALAKDLNKKSFKKDYISDSSYYTNYGIVSPKLKEIIENGIKEKFDETSDILESFDWTYNPQKVLVYAMLKKDFKFVVPFDKLTSENFAQGKNDVEYFGIDENSSKKMHKNVQALFYNSDNDFAVKLYTKDKDEVLVYRTDDDKTFDTYFADINTKTKKYKGDKRFKSDDRLKIPNVNIYQETNFADVEGHQIKGTNLVIDKTIETVDFKMDNEGVKLKSEAALIAKCTSLSPQTGRNFFFTDKFVIFLIEKGSEKPYYSMRITDENALNNK
jgi:hypothetical protein